MVRNEGNAMPRLLYVEDNLANLNQRETGTLTVSPSLRGNLGSFDRIEKSLADGARWSDFDRGISTAAYFGARANEREAA